MSAEILLNICRELPTGDAAAALAFEQIFLSSSVIEACALIQHAAKEHGTYGLVEGRGVLAELCALKEL